MPNFLAVSLTVALEFIMKLATSMALSSIYVFKKWPSLKIIAIAYIYEGVEWVRTWGIKSVIVVKV